jgi:hypothetical protein
MVDLQGVYVRTSAGLEEIRSRAHNLTRPQRNLLIVLDGKNALGTLAASIGSAAEHLVESTEALLNAGLIAPAGEALPAGSGQDEVTTQALISLAAGIFGGRADPVVRKLEKSGATPAERLNAVESAAKLAKLTIDEQKAALFLAEARKLMDN